MELLEAPSIQNPDRKCVFPLIKWLSKSKFEEYLKLQSKYPNRYQIYPYVDSIEGETSLSNRIYIGKTIPSNLDEGVQYAYDYRSNNLINLEVIGTVFKNVKNEWQLNVAHASEVIEIKNDFLILCFNDHDTFKWVKTQNDSIPKYSLRGAVDQLTREYFYIGLNSLDYKLVTGETYDYESSTWRKHENLGAAFGKVHVTHKCLYAPINNIEMRFTDYYILTLKPSPASLKILCRSVIRNLTNHCNETIKLLNKNKSGRIYLPVTLINFLKYPSYLSVGEFMIKGEKLIREDNQFEMLIENNNNLVIRSINNDVSEQDTQIKRIISSNVHSIWLQRFQIVLYKNDFSAHILYNFYNKSPEYRLRIESEASKPNYIVDVIE